LISYGVVVISYLFTQSVPAGALPLPVDGGLFTPRNLVVLGLVLQMLMLAASLLIRRQLPDPEIATQALFILELIGDGVTVLLFATGTFGAIVRMPGI
jgi:hypothetical protein